MADIAKKTVDGINAKCGNGYQFDLQFFFLRNGTEKRLFKRVPTSNGYISYSLYITDDMVRTTNEYGCTYNKYTGLKKIMAHKSIWVQEKDCATSNGLGQFVDLKLPKLTKFNMNALCEASRLMDEEKVFGKYKSETMGGVIC